MAKIQRDLIKKLKLSHCGDKITVSTLFEHGNGFVCAYVRTPPKSNKFDTKPESRVAYLSKDGFVHSDFLCEK